MNPTEVRVGYLISRYPAISHTFILREVLALRRYGFHLKVASINSPDRGPDKLTAEELAEVRQTFYVKNSSAFTLLEAFLRTLVSRPHSLAAGLLYALKLAGPDLRKMVYSLFYLGEALLVGEWMHRQKLPHLHVHFATPASTVGLIVTRVFPVTLSLTVHGPDEFYDVPGYQLAEKIRRSLFVCTIGQYARSQLMKISVPGDWGKLEISPLGVDPEVFTARRPPSHGPNDPFELLCVGRLVPSKGQHVLLEAVDRLRRRGKSVRLRFVGDGPDRTSLTREVRRRGLDGFVVLEGSVNQDYIRELYSRADLFVLPSFAEGIPVVLMEAMAMEIPCVTTFITGIPELIRHAQDGWLLPPSDDSALADAIEALLDDPALCRRLGVAGRLRVIEHYNLAKNTQRLGEIFQRRLQVSG